MPVSIVDVNFQLAGGPAVAPVGGTGSDDLLHQVHVGPCQVIPYEVFRDENVIPRHVQLEIYILIAFRTKFGLVRQQSETPKDDSGGSNMTNTTTGNITANISSTSSTTSESPEESSTSTPAETSTLTPIVWPARLQNAGIRYHGLARY